MLRVSFVGLWPHRMGTENAGTELLFHKKRKTTTPATLFLSLNTSSDETVACNALSSPQLSAFSLWFWEGNRVVLKEGGPSSLLPLSNPSSSPFKPQFSPRSQVIPFYVKPKILSCQERGKCWSHHNPLPGKKVRQPSTQSNNHSFPWCTNGESDFNALQHRHDCSYWFAFIFWQSNFSSLTWASH